MRKHTRIMCTVELNAFSASLRERKKSSTVFVLRPDSYPVRGEEGLFVESLVPSASRLGEDERRGE